MNKHDKSFNKSIEISAQKNCMIPVIPAEKKIQLREKFQQTTWTQSF